MKTRVSAPAWFAAQSMHAAPVAPEPTPRASTRDANACPHCASASGRLGKNGVCGMCWQHSEVR